MTPKKAGAIAKETYIYGYPLVDSHRSGTPRISIAAEEISSES
jgi:hypothetical protein